MIWTAHLYTLSYFKFNNRNPYDNVYITLASALTIDGSTNELWLMIPASLFARFYRSIYRLNCVSKTLLMVPSNFFHTMMFKFLLF